MAAVRAQLCCAQGAVAMVSNGHHQRIHRVLRVDGAQGQAIFVMHFLRIGDGVGHHHVHAPALQLAHQVNHFAVADVGAVLFEGDAQHAHFAARRIHARAQHHLDGAVRRVCGHVVIDSAARQNNLRVVAHLLGLVGQVVRIHADAVPADQARAKGDKVPFAASGLQHVQRVDVQPVEQDG